MYTPLYSIVCGVLCLSLAYQIIWSFSTPSPVAAKLLAAVIVFIEWLSLVVTYRLMLHPLSKFPGPFFGKITDWYSIYHCIQGDRHLNFHRLHLKHGPVVRYGPNRISINSVSALQAIYGLQANTQKAEWYTVWKQFFKTDMSMSTIDRKRHAVKRRIVTRAIKSISMKEIEGKILKNVRTLCDQLAAEDSGSDWSQARDMTKHVAYCTSDIMGDTTFSKSWNLLHSEENRDMYYILPRGIGGLSLVSRHATSINMWERHFQIFRPDLVRDTYRYETLSNQTSDWRTAQDNDKYHDFYGSLLKARDPETGNKLTRDERVAEAALLIVAGSDTMATAVTSAIFYLLHYADTLSRLQKEIRDTFETVEDITIGPVLSGCQYLVACIDEAMRLSPGWYPPGTDIAVPHYALHHNEAYHIEPFKFIPERWIKGGLWSEADISTTRSAFIPFGVGRTSCVGKELSYQEMTIIMARIVWLYDMRLAPGSLVGGGHESMGYGRTRSNEFQTWDSFVSTHEGPMVQFRLRK
ncbi:cytochrome P450 [Byssothecium circinans]|uniref:Cytochrome P450 n=1 Tax=Byssothecium circinans TaxID=147558 RepID=A0A6A5U4D8_9PLEO|nr:cytochrome P450 [Byssothecium circinans]